LEFITIRVTVKPFLLYRPLTQDTYLFFPGSYVNY